MGFFGSLVSGGAEKGAKKVAKAIQRAIDLQQNIYNESKKRYAPYGEVGTRALPLWESLRNEIPQAPDVQEYTKTFGKDANALRQTPGYQFAVGEGQRQLDRIAGNAGYRRSGNRLLDAIKWGQGLGDQLYNQEYARGLNSLLADYNLKQGEFGTKANVLGQQVGIGVNVANSLAGLGQNFANNLGSLGIQQGQAEAVGKMAKWQGLQDIVKNTLSSVASYFGAGGSLQMGSPQAGSIGSITGGGGGGGQFLGGGSGGGFAGGGFSYGGLNSGTPYLNPGNQGYMGLSGFNFESQPLQYQPVRGGNFLMTDYGGGAPVNNGGSFMRQDFGGGSSNFLSGIY